MDADLLEMVRIRDKSVDGGSRLINKSDLTDNDITLDEKSANKNAALPKDEKA